jgi:hypothetical protein
MRVTLPPIDKFRQFQPLRRFLIASTIGFHVIFLGLTPTGIPKNQKGIESTSAMQERRHSRQKSIIKVNTTKFAFKKIDLQTRHQLKASQYRFNGP